MGERTLTDLLSGKHLNMRERVERGPWPHPPLRMSDLARHIAKLLEHERWFPVPWRERLANEPVGDRTVIERQSAERFVVRFERSGPAMNLAEAGQKVCKSGEEAADFYLRSEFNLPGDLDGWKVVE